MLGLEVLPPSCFLPPAPAGGARHQPWTRPGPPSTCSLCSCKPHPCASCGAYKAFLSYYQPSHYRCENNALTSVELAKKSLQSSVTKQVARTYLAVRNLPRNVITSSQQGSMPGTCPISQCKSNSTDMKIHDCNVVLTTAAGQKLILKLVLKRKKSGVLPWMVNIFTICICHEILTHHFIPIISFFHLPKSGKMTIFFPMEAPGSLHFTHSYVPQYTNVNNFHKLIVTLAL